MPSMYAGYEEDLHKLQWLNSDHPNDREVAIESLKNLIAALALRVDDEEYEAMRQALWEIDFRD